MVRPTPTLQQSSWSLKINNITGSVPILDPWRVHSIYTLYMVWHVYIRKHLQCLFFTGKPIFAFSRLARQNWLFWISKCISFSRTLILLALFWVPCRTETSWYQLVQFRTHACMHARAKFSWLHEIIDLVHDVTVSIIQNLTLDRYATSV